MNADKVSVSVIIVSFNTKDLTRKALRALYNSSRLPKQVIVVDNNSYDGSSDMVRSEFPEAILIESTENLGFAKGNNKGIHEAATEPYIWLLNSDTEVGKQSLEQLYAYMEVHPDIGAVGPQLVYPDHSLQSVGGYFPSISNVFWYLLPLTYCFPKQWRRKLRSIALYPQPIPETGLDLDYVTGAAVLLRRAALDEVGLMPKDYFMYFEETDLCRRLQEKGWKRRVINTDPVMHVYGGSFKTKHDPRRLNLFLESLQKFVRTYYTGWRKAVILAEIKLLGKLSVWLKGLKARL